MIKRLRAPNSRPLIALLALLLPVFIGACALPVPVQIISWAIDGFSYLATDKTVADHGISMVVDKDCALFRGVTEGQVCRDEQDNDKPVMTALSQSGADLDIEPASGDAGKPLDFVEDWNSFPYAGILQTRGLDQEKFYTVSSARRSSVAYFFVLGQFTRQSNADNLTGLIPDLSPTVVPLYLGKRRIMQVVVGPVDPAHFQKIRTRVTAAGFYDVIVIKGLPVETAGSDIESKPQSGPES